MVFSKECVALCCGSLGEKKIWGHMVDCIIAQQIFTSPSPPHLERNILPHPVDTELSLVTCLGQKNMMCRSGSSSSKALSVSLSTSWAIVLGHENTRHQGVLWLDIGWVDMWGNCAWPKAWSQAWASWPQTPGRERISVHCYVHWVSGS